MDYALPRALENVSNEAIATLCQSAVSLSSDTNSTRVVKILPGIVVKYGVGVRQNEATTLEYVYRHVNGNILRVPQVYRFFTHGELVGMPLGYIVMEFIGGITLEGCPMSLELIKRVANALSHLPRLPMPPFQVPGPVYGGIPQGCLWSEYGADMEQLRPSHRSKIWRPGSIRGLTCRPASYLGFPSVLQSSSLPTWTSHEETSSLQKRTRCVL